MLIPNFTQYLHLESKGTYGRGGSQNRAFNFFDLAVTWKASTYTTLSRQYAHDRIRYTSGQRSNGCVLLEVAQIECCGTQYNYCTSCYSIATGFLQWAISNRTHRLIAKRIYDLTGNFSLWFVFLRASPPLIQSNPNIWLTILLM